MKQILKLLKKGNKWTLPQAERGEDQTTLPNLRDHSVLMNRSPTWVDTHSLFRKPVFIYWGKNNLQEFFHFTIFWSIVKFRMLQVYSKVIQLLYTHIYMYIQFFPTMVIIRYSSLCYTVGSWFIYFIYSSVFMLIPNS